MKQLSDGGMRLLSAAYDATIDLGSLSEILPDSFDDLHMSQLEWDRAIEDLETYGLIKAEPMVGGPHVIRMTAKGMNFIEESRKKTK